MPVQTQILTRRGTAASWTSTNPTLGAGEIGYETDTGRFKIGTGAAAWASLGYFNRDPLTTKGDLYTFSTTDDRLAVGANGETIVADSSTSTGLRYQVPVQDNPVINSAFQIAQRGTSFSLSNSQQYTLDRWYASTSNTGTYSRQATGDTTNLPFIQYCMRVQRTAGQTATTDFVLQQPMETVNSIPFAGKTVTLSFYARKGANFSSALSNIFLYLISGTGTDQNYSTGWTGQALPINNQSAVLTTTWQRFQFTGTVSATATELTPYFYYNPTGTAGAADYYEITGVQLEVGSVATPFKTYAGTIQGELAACQRYYYRAEGANNEALNTANFASTTLANIVITMPVQMRTDPSFNKGANDIIVIYVTSNWTSTNITLDSVSFRSASLNVTVSGATLGQAGIAYLRNMANNYLEFSAEL